MLSTANAAVSRTRTGSGCAFGQSSRPPFLKHALGLDTKVPDGFLLRLTEITGSLGLRR